MNVAAILTTFAVILPAELPDKTSIAVLLLASRERAILVWAGAAGAFAVHVSIAVAAGGAFALLPKRLVDIVVAILFLGGGAYLLLGREEGEEAEGVQAALAHVEQRGAPAVVAQAFVVVFLAEWGDVTQLLTANLAAHARDPWAVGVGALAALWTVAALGCVVGTSLVRRVPLTLLRRIAGAILVALAVVTAVSAARA